MMIWLLYIRFIVPVLGVFYGTALIADEVDDKTITYLFTRPIPRSAVLLGKYLAYLVVHGAAGAAVGDAGLLPDRPDGRRQHRRRRFRRWWPISGCWPSGWRPTAPCSRSSAPGSSGRWSSGLVFAFGWEPAVLLFPGYLKRLTVAYYLQALVTHEMPQDSAVSMLMQVFHEVPSVPVSLVCLAVIVGGDALAGAGGRSSSAKYVPVNNRGSNLNPYKTLRRCP